MQTTQCGINQARKTKVMGILNITPDSFYADSRCMSEHEIAQRTLQIIEEGADIIDVGAYSSRPNASDVSVETEWQRLLPALKTIREIAPNAIISVDTFRSTIAQRSVEQFGVDIINDISGGNLDHDMHDVVAKLGVTYVLMHMVGTPATMQQHTQYENVAHDVATYLIEKADALLQKGVANVILDPGFGFSKTTEQNFEILQKLDLLTSSKYPVLVGVSRKSMIYKSLNITPEESLDATTALHAYAITKGASILRVHDVKAAVHTREILSKII